MIIANTGERMIDFSEGIPEMLPDPPGYDETVDHAPIRRQILSKQQVGILKSLCRINA